VRVKNRQWRLRREPQGRLSADDFDLVEREIDADPQLEPGQIFVRHQIFLCAPAIRGWMSSNRPSHVPAINPGDPIISLGGGRVVKSANPKFPAGANVYCVGQWADYQVIDPAFADARVIEPPLSLLEGVGVYTINMMTAYAGLIHIGEPQAGETLVVSGAAGSVGSAALQIGRIKQMRTIGIAGGKEKCDWVLNECGADAVIDYKQGNVAARLAELCPDRIDVFFDNVGGEILQAAIDNIAKFGRIVLCGQIASYDDQRPAPGPRDMMQIIYGSVKMQGFIVTDHPERYPAMLADLKPWVDGGQLRHREDVRHGFENLPSIYAALFHGENKGTLLAVVDDEALKKPH
jgi:NADPH-dependent curcumin reductase CurA